MISGITITAAVSTHSRVCTRTLSVPLMSLSVEHTSCDSRFVFASPRISLGRASYASHQKAQNQIDDQELQRCCSHVTTRPPPQPERDGAEHQTERRATGKRKCQALRDGRRRSEKKIPQSPRESKQR